MLRWLQAWELFTQQLEQWQSLAVFYSDVNFLSEHQKLLYIVCVWTQIMDMFDIEICKSKQCLTFHWADWISHDTPHKNDLT